MKSTLISAMVALFISIPLRAEDAWNLVTVNIRIPHGQSVWTYPVTTPGSISPFRIVYVPTPSCSQFAVRPRVRYQGSPNLNEVKVQNNLFYTETRAVDLVEINFYQNKFQYQDCQISLQSLAPKSGSPSGRVYAGLLDHTGGFINRKPVALTSSFYTQDIEMVIPDYCQGYEVTELGFNSNNTFITGEKNRSRTVTFHLPQAYQLSNIAVSLLAPTGQACQIPVYVYPVNRP